ncbi:hypothetical protein N0V90_003325 [Kalmusia sp. IMI 367209]|nr:hypothetical protein N0V90_003325 [Kalmusia sp. IMI 367209]
MGPKPKGGRRTKKQIKEDRERAIATNFADFRRYAPNEQTTAAVAGARDATDPASIAKPREDALADVAGGLGSTRRRKTASKKPATVVVTAAQDDTNPPPTARPRSGINPKIAEILAGGSRSRVIGCSPASNSSVAEPPSAAATLSIPGSGASSRRGMSSIPSRPPAGFTGRSDSTYSGPTYQQELGVRGIGSQFDDDLARHDCPASKEYPGPMFKPLSPPPPVVRKLTSLQPRNTPLAPLPSYLEGGPLQPFGPPQWEGPLFPTPYHAWRMEPTPPGYPALSLAHEEVPVPASVAGPVSPYGIITRQQDAATTKPAYLLQQRINSQKPTGSRPLPDFKGSSVSSRRTTTGPDVTPAQRAELQALRKRMDEAWEHMRIQAYLSPQEHTRSQKLAPRAYEVVPRSQNTTDLDEMDVDQANDHPKNIIDHIQDEADSAYDFAMRFTEGPYYGKTVSEVGDWYLRDLCAGGENFLLWKDEALLKEVNRRGQERLDENILKTISGSPPKIKDTELLKKLNVHSMEQRGRDMVDRDGDFVDDFEVTPPKAKVRLPSLASHLLRPSAFQAPKSKPNTAVQTHGQSAYDLMPPPPEPNIRSRGPDYGALGKIARDPKHKPFLLNADQTRETAKKGQRVPLETDRTKRLDATMRRKLYGFKHGVVEK